MAKSADLSIQYKSIEELIPYINNAKIHGDDQVTLLASSIKQFGFNNPVLLDGENGIIAGHGRVMAAKKLKLESVPTIELAHLSETEKKAYILADNRIGEVDTEWDMGLVSNELEGLNGDGFDISLTGFDIGVSIEDAEQGFPDLAEGDREPFQSMTFTVHDSQKDVIDIAMDRAIRSGSLDNSVNDNKNGNALLSICEGYLENVS